MDIRILPSNISNLIAAGEVVLRPASVVKELMENAVDAGSTQVSVIIKDSGRTLIQVIDNGCGMDPDSAVVCFERHATSKLQSAEDLNNICTFGFRGEALASIAAVAEVTLRTRREEDIVGCEVAFADSQHLSTVETSCPAGSNFAVRNLFYNVPARRKFLKSDNVEFKHVIEEFTRVALTRPDIGFSLNHNGKDVFVLRPAKSEKFRIQDLLGNSAVDAVVDIAAETSVVNVSGYVCRPDLARKTTGNQFFFINGRYFRSPYLHKAVMKAYEGLVADGAVPSYFIFLTADPHSVDVNIHPAKTEIKFEDESVVFQVIYACIHESLGRNSFGSSLDFETDGAPEIPTFGRTFEQFHPSIEPPMESLDPTYNPFDNPMGSDAIDHGTPVGGFGTPVEYAPASGFGSPAGTGYHDTGNQGAFAQYGSYINKHDDYGKLFEDRSLAISANIIVDGRYIVSKAKSGLLVVHIQRARERVLYERFLKAITANGHVSQAALFPVQVMVGAQNRLVFDEHKVLLDSLGFDISAFGNDTIVVNGVPEGFSCDPAKVEALMADVLIALDEDHSSLPGAMESSMASKFARMGAASGRPLTSSSEAQGLIDSLFACEDPERTASGNKIMNIIHLDDLDKKF